MEDKGKEERDDRNDEDENPIYRALREMKRDEEETEAPMSQYMQEILLKAKAAKMNSILKSKTAKSKKDGAHSDSPGPAPCGRRHWFRGKEVDYVAKVYGHTIGWDKTGKLSFNDLKSLCNRCLPLPKTHKF